MSSPSSPKTIRNRHTNISLLVWFVIMFSIFALISVNVFYLTIGGKHFYSQTDVKSIADHVHIKQETIMAARGTIVDRNNVVLAEDVVRYKIILYLDKNRFGPNNQPAHVVDLHDTAIALAPVLNMDVNAIIAHLEKDLYQTELGVRGRNLTLQQKNDIEALNLSGVAFESMVSRNYPQGVFASHLIGFSQYDENLRANTGRMGLEATFNQTLTGTNGWRRFQTDRSGFVYKDMYYEEEPAIHGDTLVLTLDKGIQEVLELAFEQTMQQRKAELVWGAVMEVDTGNILGWGHAPSFDPNAINITDYVNVVSQHNIEPGSTMKTFVYAAAMDLGKYNGDLTYPSGVFHMGIQNGLPIRVDSFAKASSSIYNAGRRDYGNVTLDQAYSLSLNTAIGHMLTTSISPKEYEIYLERFGFFRPVQATGILESAGQKVFTYPIEMITSGYGQGSTVTTLQMLQAYSAVFSDGTMVKPKVVDKVLDSTDKSIVKEFPVEITGRPITQHTALMLQDLMRLTADEGTARFYNIPEVDILAKTGTAHIIGPNGYRTDKNLYSAVIGLPADDPKVMVYYGFIAPTSNMAHVETGPVQSILRKIMMTFDMATPGETVPTPDTVKTEIVTLPNFINRPTSSFMQFATEHNLNAIIWGDGQTIVASSFLAVHKIINTTRMFVITNKEQNTMIDLTGFSKREVQTLAQLTGLDIVIEGEGWVIEQSLKPLEMIDGQTIEVICSLNP